MTADPASPSRTCTIERPANPLAGSSLGLDIDEVLDGPPGTPLLAIAHTADGQRWAVAVTVDSANARRWLCAPHSDLALQCLRTGRALPSDLFRHTTTGWVMRVTVAADGRTAESVELCDDLHDRDLPSTPRLRTAIGGL